MADSDNISRIVVDASRADLSGLKEAKQAAAELNAELSKEPTAQEDALNDLRLAAEHAAAQERELANAIRDKDKALATRPPSLEEAISTSSNAPKSIRDVEAIEATVQSLQKRIAVSNALGQSTVQLELREQALAASLGTTAAQALISARAKEQAAIAAGKLAQEASTAATGAQQLKTVMSELTSANQLASGRIGGLNALIKAFTSETAAAVLGVVALVGILFESVKAYAGLETAVTDLDSALASQGKFTEEYSTRLQGLAATMEQASGIARDQWLGVLTTLTKFGADTSNIDQYAKAVENLAGFLQGLNGGSVESNLVTASKLFGKAMEGHTEALSRYGIEVDKNATKQEKLAQIMQQAADGGGKLLENRTKTITGEFKLFLLSIENVGKGIGAAISESEGLQNILGFLTSTINVLGGLFPTVVKSAGEFKNVVKDVGPNAHDAGDGIDDLAESASAAADGGLKKAKEQAEALKKVLDESLSTISQFKKQADELADARARAAKAEIDRREQLPATDPNHLTKDQGDAAKADIERSVGQEKLDASLQELKARKGELDASRAQLEAMLFEAKKYLDQANGAVRATGAIVPSLTPSNAKKVNQTLEDEKSRKQKEADDASDPNGSWYNPKLADSLRTQIANITALQDKIKIYEHALADAADAAKSLSTLQKQTAKLQEDLNQKTAQLDTDTKVNQFDSQAFASKSSADQLRAQREAAKAALEEQKKNIEAILTDLKNALTGANGNNQPGSTSEAKELPRGKDESNANYAARLKAKILDEELKLIDSEFKLSESPGDQAKLIAEWKTKLVTFDKEIQDAILKRLDSLTAEAKSKNGKFSNSEPVVIPPPVPSTATPPQPFPETIPGAPAGTLGIPKSVDIVPAIKKFTDETIASHKATNDHLVAMAAQVAKLRSEVDQKLQNVLNK